MFIINGKRFDKKYSRPVGVMEHFGEKLHIREMGEPNEVLCNVLVVNSEIDIESLDKILAQLSSRDVCDNVSIKELTNLDCGQLYEIKSRLTKNRYLVCIMNSLDKDKVYYMIRELYIHGIPLDIKGYTPEEGFEMVKETGITVDVLKSFVFNMFDYQKAHKMEVEG